MGKIFWGFGEQLNLFWGFGEHKQNTFRELRQKKSGIWGDQSNIFRKLGSKDPPPPLPHGGHICWFLQCIFIGIKQLIAVRRDVRILASFVVAQEVELVINKACYSLL